MTTISERLKQARERANYETAADAARAFGWNVNTYRSHESGVRGVPRDAIVKYATAFNVQSNWLLTGKSDRGAIQPRPTTIRNVPLVDTTELPRARSLIGEDGMGAELSPALAVPIARAGRRAFAIEMPDDSMAAGTKPIHKGDYMVIDPDYPHMPGSYVLVFDPILEYHTVRRWRLVGDGSAELVPANQHYPTAKVPADTDAVLGCVRGRLDAF